MTIEKQPQSRRAFLSNSVMGVVSVGLAGTTPEQTVARPSQQQGSALPIRRTLGRTGVELPVVSIGAMNSDSPALYHYAYDKGIRHFDTAETYLRGRSEEVLGSFMKERGNREEICLATKVGSSIRNVERSQYRSALQRTFEGCLRRLQTDYVDILYHHGRNSADAVSDEIAEGFFAELQEQGNIRFPGISTHSGQAEVLNEMTRGDFWTVAEVAFNVTMAQNQELLTAMRNAADRGVGIIGMKALGGARRGPDAAASVPPFNQTAMMKWVLNHEEVTTIIPGITTFDQVDLDWSVVSDLSYTEEEQSFLAESDLQGLIQFCQQCRECIPTCPKRVDIPTLMRTHMYAAQYSNFTHARMTLDEISSGQSIFACDSCVECAAQCSNSINIPARIDTLKSMYLA